MSWDEADRFCREHGERTFPIIAQWTGKRQGLMILRNRTEMDRLLQHVKEVPTLYTDITYIGLRWQNVC